ncbi:MAG: hypothetical protein AB4042_17355, partial [Leptolyngbyaceae cyanobacterium]
PTFTSEGDRNNHNPNHTDSVESDLLVARVCSSATPFLGIGYWTPEPTPSDQTQGDILLTLRPKVVFN